jgi:sterol-4alpha-carboxylate 3-dehydrogenase (decarboxylating)
MEGPILVTGGAGFFGYHLIKALLEEPNYRPIVSINRNPKSNFHDDVDYRAGNIADEDFVQKLFNEIKPRLIFHTAAPSPDSNWATARISGIDGTKVMLKVAARCPSVEAFVFTSSVNVLAGTTHCNIDESGPLWDSNSKCIPYWKAKTIAEQHVLEANCKNLRTVSLRLCLIIGERDPGFVPAFVDSFKRGETGYQVGDNTNRIDTVSARNAASAHLLAAEALMNSSGARGRVDGEAFLITDGNPLPFWDVCRIIWRAAGDTSDPKDATIIPAWIAYTWAVVLEVLYGIFTLGRKSPPLTRLVVGFCVNEFTYNVDKAKKVLGYRPVVRTQEVLKDSVEWELKHRERDGQDSKIR